jgi:predicted ester cyclase
LRHDHRCTQPRRNVRADAQRARSGSGGPIRGDNYRNHNAFVGDGREANRTFWAGFFAALPDLTATMEDLIIAGDRVVGRFVYRGTHAGEFMGIPATGRSVEMRSIDIWRVDNGMFVEHWDELNTLQLLAQMGALPQLAGDDA